MATAFSGDFWQFRITLMALARPQITRITISDIRGAKPNREIQAIRHHDKTIKELYGI